MSHPNQTLCRGLLDLSAYPWAKSRRSESRPRLPSRIWTTFIQLQSRSSSPRTPIDLLLLDLLPLSRLSLHHLRLGLFLLDLLQFLSPLLALVPGMLDRQAPDIEVVTNGHYNIYDEAAVHAYTQAETAKDKGYLVDIIAQSAWPANANVSLEEGTEGVDGAVGKGCNEDLVSTKGEAVGFYKMSNDDLADAEGVDEPDVEGKRYEVVVEDSGLEKEVYWDENPGVQNWCQAEESNSDGFLCCSAGVDYILDARIELADSDSDLDGIQCQLPEERVEDKYNSAVEHIPLIKG
jgi:hypothetical protein